MIYWKLVGREPVMGLRGLENCLGLEYSIVLLVRVLPEMNHEHATRLGLARFSYLLRQLVTHGSSLPNADRGRTVLWYDRKYSIFMPGSYFD